VNADLRIAEVKAFAVSFPVAPEDRVAKMEADMLACKMFVSGRGRAY